MIEFCSGKHSALVQLAPNQLRAIGKVQRVNIRITMLTTPPAHPSPQTCKQTMNQNVFHQNTLNTFSLGTTLTKTYLHVICVLITKSRAFTTSIHMQFMIALTTLISQMLIQTLMLCPFQSPPLFHQYMIVLLSGQTTLSLLPE